MARNETARQRRPSSRLGEAATRWRRRANVVDGHAETSGLRCGGVMVLLAPLLPFSFLFKGTITTTLLLKFFAQTSSLLSFAKMRHVHLSRVRIKETRQERKSSKEDWQCHFVHTWKKEQKACCWVVWDMHRSLLVGVLGRTCLSSEKTSSTELYFPGDNLDDGSRYNSPAICNNIRFAEERQIIPRTTIT